MMHFFLYQLKKALYWAGFLAADGCLRHNHSYNIKLELSTEDRKHIELFKEHLETEAIIRDTEREASELLKKKYPYKEKYYASYIVNVKNSKIITIFALYYGYFYSRTSKKTSSKISSNHSKYRKKLSKK